MKSVECGFKVEECVCQPDPLLEDEEASDYINLEQDARRMLTKDGNKANESG